MRPLLLFVLIMGAYFSTSAQLPELTTTSKKAVSDFDNGITNDRWFVSDDKKSYSCIFRVTAVGLKHAIDRYESVLATLGEERCKNDDIISRLAKNSDGTLDYEMLAITIKEESSELSRICLVSNNKASSVVLNSSKNLVLVSIFLK